MQRVLGLGYQSEWAKNHLPTRRERNDFYTRVGQLTSPDQVAVGRLGQITSAMSPAEILSNLS